jgi:hypothetical protein
VTNIKAAKPTPKGLKPKIIRAPAGRHPLLAILVPKKRK